MAETLAVQCRRIVQTVLRQDEWIETNREFARSSAKVWRFIDRAPAKTAGAKLMGIDERLAKIESLLAALVERETIRDWYSTEQFARLVGKAEFTVREWARLGRIHAQKRQSGRGAYPAWVIAHHELLRFQREGLLPIQGASIRPKG